MADVLIEVSKWTMEERLRLIEKISKKQLDASLPVSLDDDYHRIWMLAALNRDTLELNRDQLESE